MGFYNEFLVLHLSNADLTPPGAVDAPLKRYNWEVVRILWHVIYVSKNLSSVLGPSDTRRCSPVHDRIKQYYNPPRLTTHSP